MHGALRGLLDIRTAPEFITTHTALQPHLLLNGGRRIVMNGPRFSQIHKLSTVLAAEVAEARLVATELNQAARQV